MGAAMRCSQVTTHAGPDVHVLIVACDYKGTQWNLDALEDAHKIENLCRNCGVEDMTVLSDRHHLLWNKHEDYPFKDHLFEVIGEVGRRCFEGETFFFYFAGHGVRLQTTPGANREASGEDQALVLVNEDGDLDIASPTDTRNLLLDDELNACIASSVPDQVNVVCLVDACHSGSIVDLDDTSSPLVQACQNGNNRGAVSISACQDSEEALQDYAGGLVTSAMIKAVEEIHKQRVRDEVDEDELVSCQEVFDLMVTKLAASRTPTHQHPMMQQAQDGDAQRIVWPLMM